MGKGHCYYSGSPLQYAFDESADKGVKVFDLTADGVLNLRDIPLTKGKKLIRLEADSVETAHLLLEQYPHEFVEMKLTLSEPLTSADSVGLAKRENLVSLLAEIQTEDSLTFESRKGLSDEGLFDAFYKSSFGTEAKVELKTLFLTTLKEIEEHK